MNGKKVSELVQTICSEDSEAIMSITRNLYIGISNKLADQPWNEEIYGDTYNELWDHAVFELQTQVSNQIAENIRKLFSELAYLDKEQ